MNLWTWADAHPAGFVVLALPVVSSGSVFLLLLLNEALRRAAGHR